MHRITCHDICNIEVMLFMYGCCLYKAPGVINDSIQATSSCFYNKAILRSTVTECRYNAEYVDPCLCWRGSEEVQ